MTLATPGRRRASGALASAPETALLYNPTDINRLYFGTDTHAQSVLVGATLALGLRLWAERNRKGAEGDWQARTVESQLQKAVHIATAGGARMVLMTKPCQSTGEQPDAVQDLNAYVCPGGQYTEDLDGVPIRESDGSHFDMQPGGGGDYLAPAILPYWIELGHLQEAGTNGAEHPRPETAAASSPRSEARAGQPSWRRRATITSGSPSAARSLIRSPHQPVRARAWSK